MPALVLAAALLTAAPAAQQQPQPDERWRAVAFAGADIHAVEQTGLRTMGEGRTFRMVSWYGRQQGNVRYAVSWNRIDCDRRTIVAMSEERYDDAGVEIDRHTPAGLRFDPIQPGTVADRVRAAVCDDVWATRTPSPSLADFLTLARQVMDEPAFALPAPTGWVPVSIEARAVHGLDASTIQTSGALRTVSVLSWYADLPAGTRHTLGRITIDCDARTVRPLDLTRYDDTGAELDRETFDAVEPLIPGSAGDHIRAAVCDGDWPGYAQAGADTPQAFMARADTYFDALADGVPRSF